MLNLPKKIVHIPSSQENHYHTTGPCKRQKSSTESCESGKPCAQGHTRCSKTATCINHPSSGTVTQTQLSPITGAECSKQLQFHHCHKSPVRLGSSTKCGRQLLPRLQSIAPQSPNNTKLASNTNGPRPLVSKSQARPSHVFSVGPESDLNDHDRVAVRGNTSGGSSKPAKPKAKKALPVKGDNAVIEDGAKPKQVKRKPKVPLTDGDTLVPGTLNTAQKKKKTADGKERAKKVPKSSHGEATSKGNGKTSAKTDQKDKKKSSDADDKVKKVPKAKPKPKPKPEIPVDPPVFEKVDTRLGREEAEHRIMLREFMVRFQAVLSIPDRSLGPLDDFDRPVSDASVRTFVGAMLDLIKDELEGDGDEDLLELLTQHREELRYYGDLARLRNTFEALAKPLRLRMPVPLISPTRAGLNADAARGPSELDDDYVDDAGPTRRSAAVGRTPSQPEVVRMLLALADRTLSTPAIRKDLVWEAPENEARRIHTRTVKGENERHQRVQKKLAGAKLVAFGPGSGPAIETNKQETEKEKKEHAMELALADVNLRAVIGQRALRHEPLGTDLDGRVYYVLNHQPIEDNQRPPQAWASGLLVWGTGVPLIPKPDTSADEDDLPMSVERWCHFGKSSEVRQLAKWIDYRFRKAMKDLQILNTPSKSRSKSTLATPRSTKIAHAISAQKARSTPRVDKTPTKQTLLKMGPSQKTMLGDGRKATPEPTKIGQSPRSTKKPRLTLEVVIPLRSRKSSEATDTSSHHDHVNDKDRDDVMDDGSDSELSELDSDSDSASESDFGSDDDAEELEQVRKELLAQLAPKGYIPSIETMKEEGVELVRKTTEVAEWLEVLEWKGMGEV